MMSSPFRYQPHYSMGSHPDNKSPLEPRVSPLLQCRGNQAIVSVRLTSRDTSTVSNRRRPRTEVSARENRSAGDYLRRFLEARDDFDFVRAFVALEDFPFVLLPLRDLPEDFVRAFPARDLPDDFFAEVRLRVNFGIRLDVLTTCRIARFARWPVNSPFSAALPATAPTTPPTTAPMGPATLPAAAPATAPTVCLRTGGIWMFWDDCDSRSFFAFELLGISNGLLRRLSRLQTDSHQKHRLAVEK